MALKSIEAQGKTYKLEFVEATDEEAAHILAKSGKIEHKFSPNYTEKEIELVMAEPETSALDVEIKHGS